MWYEILPTIGILSVCVGYPQLFDYIVYRLSYHYDTRRPELSTPFLRRMHNRDIRVTGTWYNQIGFEKIPDKE